MSLALVRLYFELAILLTVGLGLAAGALAVTKRLAGRQPARPWLKLGRATLMASVVYPALALVLLRPEALFRAPVQVWSRDARHSSRLALTVVPPTLRAPAPSSGASLEEIVAVLAALLAVSSAAGVIGLVREYRRSWVLCRSAIPIRTRGRLRICVSERVTVPFSAWTGRRVYIVVPEHFVLAPEHLRVALVHEMAHLRSRDTVWVYVPVLLRALMPWHPAAHAWVRWLARLEELACDEQVLNRPSITPRDYGECLLWAAESAQVLSCPPALAGPMLDRSRSFLERRITMLFDPPARTRRSSMFVIALSALIALGVTSALARGTIADRRLGTKQIQAIADDLARSTGFRVAVDPTVVEEVNSIVSRAETRAKFREGLERLAAYRTIGAEALGRHQVPVELLAIPQTESRVQALPESMNPMRSAGIWQFIPATARRYGLRVDETTDERMDPARAAEAAASLLSDLHEEFQDWRLAVAAYNAGSEKVRQAIAQNGTSDPVALAKTGAISRYASAVMAAALLIHQPALLD